MLQRTTFGPPTAPARIHTMNTIHTPASHFSSESFHQLRSGDLQGSFQVSSAWGASSRYVPGSGVHWEMQKSWWSLFAYFSF